MKNNFTYILGWHQFEKGTLRDLNGRPVQTKREARDVIQAKQFIALLPKLGLEMIKAHNVFYNAGIQIQWLFMGTNNLTRLLKNFLCFNGKITKVIKEKLIDTSVTEKLKEAVEL